MGTLVTKLLKLVAFHSAVNLGQLPTLTEWVDYVHATAPEYLVIDDGAFENHLLQELRDSNTQLVANVTELLGRYLATVAIDLARPEQWYLGQAPDFSFIPSLDVRSPSNDGAPFIQKFIVPAGSRMVPIGDLHGSAPTCTRILQHQLGQKTVAGNTKFLDNDFKPQDDTYYIFLGDYTDRGRSGLEVINTLLRLKMARPDHIIMIRGNHEYHRINAEFFEELGCKITGQPATSLLGIVEKITSLSGSTQCDAALATQVKQWRRLFAKIMQFYNTLPVAAFIGVQNPNGSIDYVQFSHAGFEVGYNPKGFLNSAPDNGYAIVEPIDREMAADMHHEIHIQEAVNAHRNCQLPPDVFLGYNWMDFYDALEAAPGQALAFNPERGWAATKEFVQFMLANMSGEHATVHAIVRGHQHPGSSNNPEKPSMLDRLMTNYGMVTDWDGLVYTLVNARSAFGLEFDSYAVINTAEEFEDWDIEHWVDQGEPWSANPQWHRHAHLVFANGLPIPAA